ncbi:hypothetical protein OQA88_10655 [Cercophora sp. LCS_1]
MASRQEVSALLSSETRVATPAVSPTIPTVSPAINPTPDDTTPAAEPSQDPTDDSTPDDPILNTTTTHTTTGDPKGPSQLPQITNPALVHLTLTATTTYTTAAVTNSHTAASAALAPPQQAPKTSAVSCPVTPNRGRAQKWTVYEEAILVHHMQAGMTYADICEVRSHQNAFDILYRLTSSQNHLPNRTAHACESHVYNMRRKGKLGPAPPR